MTESRETLSSIDTSYKMVEEEEKTMGKMFRLYNEEWGEETQAKPAAALYRRPIWLARSLRSSSSSSFPRPRKTIRYSYETREIVPSSRGKATGGLVCRLFPKKNFGVVMCSAWGQFVIDVFWQSEFDRSCLSYPNTTLPFSRQVTSTLTACTCVVPVGKSKKKYLLRFPFVYIPWPRMAKEGFHFFFLFNRNLFFRFPLKNV